MTEPATDAEGRVRAQRSLHDAEASSPPTRIWTKARVAGVVVSVAWAAAFFAGARTNHTLEALSAASILAIAATVLYARGSLRARLGLGWRRGLVHAGIGAVVGFITVVATVVLYPVLRGFVPSLASDVAHFYELVPFSNPTLPAIVLVIVAEELLWRGLFLDGVTLGARSPNALPRATFAALVLGSACYGLGQLGSGEPVLAAVALFMGLIWAVETVVTGALVASLVSHAIWTLWVFGVAPLEVAGGAAR